MADTNGPPSQPQQPGLIASTDYQLKSLQLLTSTGEAYDVTNIMLELHLYEDIFSPCVTGSLIIGDGGDLISTLQMHGNEFLSMIIDKPSLGQPIKKVFRIYKIGDRNFTTSALQNYTLYFCSEEMFLSTQLQLSKSYKGLKISDMVKDILLNKLQVDSGKISKITDSSGSFDLIVPRMSPLEAINWLTPKAYTSKGNLFFFFENRNGFNFVSYEDILSGQSYANYQRNVKIDTDPAKNWNGYTFFHVAQDHDLIKANRMGAFSTTLLNLDIVNRTFVTTTQSFTKNDSLLNQQLPLNGLKNRLGFAVAEAKDNMIKFAIKNDTDPTTNPSKLEQWVPQTIARLGQLNTFKAVMTVPGDVLLTAGSIITVIIPQMIVQDQKTEASLLRSGKFLVSAVHHKFMLDMMTTTVELLSDSVSAQIAPPSNLPGVHRMVSL